ncbi:uncharacterized protein FIESC28_11530 [Fusarium coffeatum]|uniref:Uncharacterized protein n=1 Tax=Fusarium coffeatum TaxID=231269 RepID=A0A366QI95_9HYPO|nr:uncharacterized protein FIESC28_11530 [Fusarium coffeatum]RBR04603.1 hypothetical protein FIESC28_11530 [Fusarium coffeatum]
MTRIIIIRKPRSSSPTTSPSIPSSPASSSTASSPSHTPITRSATKTQVRLYRGSKECPICKAIIVNRNNALKRHIDRHATLAELETTNFDLEPDRNGLSDADTARARKMWQSIPASIRNSGGIFQDGPLAGKGEVAGMPEVFMVNGRLKKKFMWIRKDLGGRIGRRPLKALKDGNSGAADSPNK